MSPAHTQTQAQAQAQKTGRTDRALENVQNLYLMQFRLLDLLESDLRNPVTRKEVRAQMKEFEGLLKKADWRYMGGIDVWETLKALPLEMSKKLRESAVPVLRRSLKASAPARARVAKRVVKKAAKKRK